MTYSSIIIFSFKRFFDHLLFVFVFNLFFIFNFFLIIIINLLYSWSTPCFFLILFCGTNKAFNAIIFIDDTFWLYLTTATHKLLIASIQLIVSISTWNSFFFFFLLFLVKLKYILIYILLNFLPFHFFRFLFVFQSFKIPQCLRVLSCKLLVSWNISYFSFQFLRCIFYWWGWE